MTKCNCWEIDGQAFEGVEEDWSGKAFYVVDTLLAFHVPLRLGRDIRKATSAAKAQGYDIADTRRILQKDAWFRGQLLVEIGNPHEAGAGVLVMPPGTRAAATFFKGPWSRLDTPARELVNSLAAGGAKVREVYFWYLTCPRCARERGWQTVVWATY